MSNKTINGLSVAFFISIMILTSCAEKKLKHGSKFFSENTTSFTYLNDELTVYKYNALYVYNNHTGIEEWNNSKTEFQYQLFLAIGNKNIITGLPRLYDSIWEVINVNFDEDKEYLNIVSYQTTEMANSLYVFLVNYGEFAVIAFSNEGLYILSDKNKEEVSTLFQKKFFGLVM